MSWGDTLRHVRNIATALATAAAAATAASFAADLGALKYALGVLTVVCLLIVLVTVIAEARVEHQAEQQKAAQRGQPLTIDVSRIDPMRDSGLSPLIAFTLTNQGAESVKLYSLRVEAVSRQKASSAHLHRPEAVPVTYSATVKVGEPGTSGEVLEQEHVLEVGETEAYRVIVQAAGGWRYELRLVGDWAYIGQSRQEFQGPTFEIAFPITGADELLGLLGEGEDT